MASRWQTLTQRSAKLLVKLRPVQFRSAIPAWSTWLQLSHQYGLGHGEWSGYDPDAFAFAEADEVNISITGKVNAGDTGVVAISKAEAYAEGDYPLAVAISDDVNVEISGKVKAQGTGVFAGSFADASVGEAGCPEDSCYEEQGNVTVAVKKGKVQGGIGYYGVVVKGGDDNLIEVDKKATVTSKSFMAILGGERRRDGRELWPGCRRCRP